jgi:hypothetical protein
MSVAEFLHLGQHYVPTITLLRQWYDYGVVIYPTDPHESARAFSVYTDGKARLPLATIGGNYYNGGLANDLITPTNLMCLDLDATKPDKAAKLLAAGQPVPNAHVTDWQRIKRQLSHLPWVAYCGLSVGGHGLFLVVPIDDYRMHAERWQAAAHLLLEHYGLVIDPATKDPTRARFISYDPQPFVNPQAEVFRVAKPRPVTITPSYAPTTHRTAPVSSAAEAVTKCVEEIERKGVDITSDYSDWCSIAAALYSEFGEAGEDYFVRVSQFYPGATESCSRRKYKQCSTMSRISIGTFFKICRDHGIRYERTSTPTAKATPAPRPASMATPSASPIATSSPTAAPTPSAASATTAPSSSPAPAPSPSSGASATTADKPRIRYATLLPFPYDDAISNLTPEEFNDIFSPAAVAKAMSMECPF